MSEQTIIDAEELVTASPGVEDTQADESVIDLLNRDEVIKTLLQIAEALSTQKKSACYALDGKWGIGKTFVLDRLEEQLKKVSTAPDTIDSRYLIFRYNCWEYDYYEEPLLAIISVLLDQLETYASKFTEEAKGRIIQTLKKVGKAFVKIGVNWVASRIGVDSEEMVEAVQEGLTEKVNDKSFDQYINFKKNLNDLRDELKNMSSNYTVIFIVDELDRCLPEYSIRVLERLHHLMEGLPNTQMLLAVDAEQLEHTVRQIFGDGANVSKYLSKFIQFKVLLTEGDPIEIEKFNVRFKEYRNLFDKETHLFAPDDTISTFIRMIFKGVEVRTKIALVDKCQLIHSLCTDGMNKSDPIYMCLELFLSTIYYHGVESYCKCMDSVVFYFDPESEDSKQFNGMEMLSAMIQTRGLVSDRGTQHQYVLQSMFWGWLAVLNYSIFLRKPDNVYVLDMPAEYNTFELYAKIYWAYLNQIV